jgi:hypothetical protein
MPAYDGKRVVMDLTLTVWGVVIIVSGTIEILDIRKELG